MPFKKKKKSTRAPWAIALGTLAVSVALIGTAAFVRLVAPGESQALTAIGFTFIDASLTGSVTWTQSHDWQLSLQASPTSWNAFRGDSVATTYTLGATKTMGSDQTVASGTVCVTNTGGMPTAGLAIVAHVQEQQGTGPFQSVATASVSVASAPMIAAGGSSCYPYSISFPRTPGAQYRVASDVTITNHLNSIPGSAFCAGPSVCPFGVSPVQAVTMPATPTVTGGTAQVSDTLGHTWTFSTTTQTTFTQTSTCDADAGTQTVTATVQGTGETASASTAIQCYALQVSSTAQSSYAQTTSWTAASAPSTSTLTLTAGQGGSVPFSIGLTGTTTVSGWMASGTIQITNPAPMGATIASVTDLVGAASATVQCGVTFPYTLPADQTLTCTYTRSLTNASNVTSAATVTLQNYTYTAPASSVPSVTTAFSSSAPVDFGQAVVASQGSCVSIMDTAGGARGTYCTDQLVNGALTVPLVAAIGPFTTCGPRTIMNTVVVSPTGGTPLMHSWSVSVTVPCTGGSCVSSMGYWKNHDEYIPQYLPISLGSGGGKTLVVTTKDQAKNVLGQSTYGSPSNGITKVYAQLLAAKLNIARGADGSSIAATMAAADAFLVTKNWQDWSSLPSATKTQVTGWASTFEQYNTGGSGPAHCSDADDDDGDDDDEHDD